MIDFRFWGIIYDYLIGSTALKSIYHMCYIGLKSHCEYFSEDFIVYI